MTRFQLSGDSPRIETQNLNVRKLPLREDEFRTTLDNRRTTPLNSICFVCLEALLCVWRLNGVLVTPFYRSPDRRTTYTPNPPPFPSHVLPTTRITLTLIISNVERVPPTQTEPIPHSDIDSSCVQQVRPFKFRARQGTLQICKSDPHIATLRYEQSR